MATYFSEIDSTLVHVLCQRISIQKVLSEHDITTRSYVIFIKADGVVVKEVIGYARFEMCGNSWGMHELIVETLKSMRKDVTNYLNGLWG